MPPLFLSLFTVCYGRLVRRDFFFSPSGGRAVHFLSFPIPPLPGSSSSRPTWAPHSFSFHPTSIPFPFALRLFPPRIKRPFTFPPLYLFLDQDLTFFLCFFSQSRAQFFLDLIGRPGMRRSHPLPPTTLLFSGRGIALPVPAKLAISPPDFRRKRFFLCTSSVPFYPPFQAMSLKSRG